MCLGQLESRKTLTSLFLSLSLCKTMIFVAPSGQASAILKAADFITFLFFIPVVVLVFFTVQDGRAGEIRRAHARSAPKNARRIFSRTAVLTLLTPHSPDPEPEALRAQHPLCVKGLDVLHVAGLELCVSPELHDTLQDQPNNSSEQGRPRDGHWPSGTRSGQPLPSDRLKQQTM